jgi:hypothetical protein
MGSVTKNQTKKMASASNSPVNAIESILLLVCVVILFFLFDEHASNRIGTLLLYPGQRGGQQNLPSIFYTPSG